MFNATGWGYRLVSPPFHTLNLLVIVMSSGANALVEAVPTLIGVRVRCWRILTGHLTMRCVAGSRVRPDRGTGQQHNVPDVEDSNDNTNRGTQEKRNRQVHRVVGLQIFHQPGEISGIHEEILRKPIHATQDLVGATHEDKYVRPSVPFPGLPEEENLDKNEDEGEAQREEKRQRPQAGG